MFQNPPVFADLLVQKTQSINFKFGLKRENILQRYTNDQSNVTLLI